MGFLPLLFGTIFPDVTGRGSFSQKQEFQRHPRLGPVPHPVNPGEEKAAAVLCSAHATRAHKGSLKMAAYKESLIGELPENAQVTLPAHLF